MNINDKVQAAFDEVISTLNSVDLCTPVVSQTALFVEHLVYRELSKQDMWAEFRVIINKDQQLSLWFGSREDAGWDDICQLEQDSKVYHIYPSPYQI